MNDKPGRKRARRPRNRISRLEGQAQPPKADVAKDAKEQPSNGEPSHDGFDRWLDRSLHRLFDRVATEPVPDDLLKLLDEPKKPTRDRD
jgi:hypothetical protein